MGIEVDKLGNSEVFDPASLEVRFGDPEKDAPRLLELFTQPSTIEHLAAITPYTTEDEVRQMHKDGNIVLLTAETPSGLIVGTYSIYRPGHGSLVSEGGRLVVDEKYRGLHISSKLIKAGNAVMFEEGHGEFTSNKSQVYVITGIKDDHIPQKAYEREGYLKSEPNTGCTYSWNNEQASFVLRNSQPMYLYKDLYMRDYMGEREIYYPKERPVISG